MSTSHNSRCHNFIHRGVPFRCSFCRVHSNPFMFPTLRSLAIYSAKRLLYSLVRSCFLACATSILMTNLRKTSHKRKRSFLVSAKHKYFIKLRYAKENREKSSLNMLSFGARTANSESELCSWVQFLGRHRSEQKENFPSVKIREGREKQQQTQTYLIVVAFEFPFESEPI